MVETECGKGIEKGTRDWMRLEQHCFALLVAAFQKDATKDALRTIHIQTSLHAGVRWDRTRMLKENDFMDFHHAAAGIGYCDAIFTERSLSAMIKRPDIALDKQFGCHVGATIEDALSYLETCS